ncbi:MAG TPA: hypothetical protein VF690_02995 [Hymenobacter sp.]
MSTSPARSLLEQVTQAELAYYRQVKSVVVTAEDAATWKHELEKHESLRLLLGKVPASFLPLSYSRHVLER